MSRRYVDIFEMWLILTKYLFEMSIILMKYRNLSHLSAIDRINLLNLVICLKKITNVPFKSKFQSISLLKFNIKKNLFSWYIS